MDEKIKQLCVRTTLSAHRSEGFAYFGHKFVFNDCGNIKLLAYKICSRRLRQGWQSVYPGRTVYQLIYARCSDTWDKMAGQKRTC
jgi:hypothetical protein